MSPIKLTNALLLSTRLDENASPFLTFSNKPFSTVSLTMDSWLLIYLSLVSSMKFLAYFIIVMFVSKEHSCLLSWLTSSPMKSLRSELNALSFALRRLSSSGSWEGFSFKCVVIFDSFWAATLMRLWFGYRLRRELISYTSSPSLILVVLSLVANLRVLNVFDISILIGLLHTLD